MSASARDTVLSPLNSGKGGECGPGLCLADLCEVQINHGRLEGGVTQVGGDLPHAGACLQHVRGIAVAQGVDANLLMVLHEAAFVFGDLDGGPDAGFGHGLAAVVEGLAETDAGAFPTASRGWKEPVGIAVPTPKHPESGEQLRRDGNLAGLAAFGVADTQNEAFAVDVSGADVQRLAHAQPALIDEGEVGAVAPVAERPQQFGNFPAGENVWKGFLALDLDLRPNLPALAQVIAVEGSKGADGLVERGTGEFALRLEVKQEVEDLP